MPFPLLSPNSTKIFISYRRDESSAHAGRLSDRLRKHFGSWVFIDVRSIRPGADFVEELKAAVGSCKILLAVIGREWLTLTDAGGRRRLDDPNDILRLEIATALSRGVKVIPVLVDRAAMPGETDLPPDIAPLARRQNFEVSDRRWNEEVRELIKEIESDIGRPKRRLLLLLMACAAGLILLTLIALAYARFKAPPGGIRGVFGGGAAAQSSPSPSPPPTATPTPSAGTDDPKTEPSVTPLPAPRRTVKPKPTPRRTPRPQSNCTSEDALLDRPC